MIENMKKHEGQSQLKHEGQSQLENHKANTP